VVDDTVTAVRVEIDPSIGSTITVKGSDEFVARVQADLAMLAASPTGQQMLVALDEAAIASQQDGGHFNIGANDGNLVTIVEWDQDSARTSAESGPDALEDEDGPDSGTDVEISYKPRLIHLTRSQNGQDTWIPPVVVLYHELAHAVSFVTGNGETGVYGGPGVDGDLAVPEVERQASGLPVDHDDDPSTPEQVAPQQPIVLTENGLRRELGIPDRTSYENRPQGEEPVPAPPVPPGTIPS
jgi:hypothetical protein